jgi:hypothetical protein
VSVAPQVVNLMDCHQTSVACWLVLDRSCSSSIVLATDCSDMFVFLPPGLTYVEGVMMMVVRPHGTLGMQTYSRRSLCAQKT